MYKVGLDIGSTTAKVVLLYNDKILFSDYIRHNADILNTIVVLLEKLRFTICENNFTIAITGSVGMGIAEQIGIPFMQEVSAAAEFVKCYYPAISTMIEIGGEDAKIVYFDSKGVTDLRMNGNCAGGTGAFIDQMSALLGISVNEMNDLALHSKRIYPIASRCGVFSKTDIQNLISKNADKADIVASIFHAVAVQTVVTLSHGCDIKPKILFAGGPLTFIPALRKAFVNYLHLSDDEIVSPENAHLIPAWGTALCNKNGKLYEIDNLIKILHENKIKNSQTTNGLTPIFETSDDYVAWKLDKQQNSIKEISLQDYNGCDTWLGIDSGSTTTKIVLIDENERMLFKYYSPNNGNPVDAVRKGLQELECRCAEAGVIPILKGGCSTGYGEDLIRAAFNLDYGIIETIAHYLSARKLTPDVSFILDIGGQDMKAMFVKKGVLSRIEINEACSSGCGSFIETFAKSLNLSVSDFASEACMAKLPCDLGTRCTVFMNSKVKQVLREGASVGDIAAGLSYSVVKNCLYKVLKLKNLSELGDKIVVQGGTMHNDSIVRAFEKLVQQKVFRSNFPELMGAYGCALYAKNKSINSGLSLQKISETATYTTRELQCKGCVNNCLVQKYLFANGNVFYSGNKCEKVFSNNGDKIQKGQNGSAIKYELLFNRAEKTSANSSLLIGIPRVLNMYEDYPFWHALFETAGIRTVLSDTSTFDCYEKGVHSVMSDNICFPAKLVHSHIYNLVEKNVDRIFMPYVILEKSEDMYATNSYNCPIVSGYSDVIKSAINPSIQIDSPVITMQNQQALQKSCTKYLRTFGLSESTIKKAVKAAIFAWQTFEKDIIDVNKKILAENRKNNKLTILLAGRPYHTDPLIQHKISDIIAGMGVSIITEDIVRTDSVTFPETNMVLQWAYINRLMKAAQWVAEQGNDIHLVQLTSFGCGPDAFLSDEINGILQRNGKSLTILKVDDVNNIGSLKLRVRSLIESLKFNYDIPRTRQPFVSTAPNDHKCKILVPYFTDYISPLMPALFSLGGYDIEVLPKSDVASADCGLAYANNEICYPATLIVGDMIKALKSGRYDLSKTSVAISQTGGQCRASNYISLIKNGLINAGFEKIPVLSLALGGGLKNDFKFNWLKVLHIVVDTVLYGDCIAKLYYSSVANEQIKGEASNLRDYYLAAADKPIRENKPSNLQELLSQAVKDFNEIRKDTNKNLPCVGVVGEIFLKFNSFAHKNVVDWMTEQHVEVVPPALIDFFMQNFVNNKVSRKTYIEHSSKAKILLNHIFYKIVNREIKKFNRICSNYKDFKPFNNIFEEAKNGADIVSLSAQFGEGWLLPAEIVSFAKNGVNNVLSLQPFGCIANHIICKGVEKRIKTLYPQLNLLSLDFDSGVSDVNITNRMRLMFDNLK